MLVVAFQSAHAKINLAIAVGPPPGGAGDGLHPICSWFAPIDLADELRVELLRDGPSRYEIVWAEDAPRQSPIDWPIENDLAVRAHRLLEREVGRPLPIALRLTKRIPVGGGLGGGSSDAAAMLRAVIGVHRLEIPADRVHAIALSLGSDVPYFLLDPPSPAIVEGVGESVTPTPPIAGSLILILPPFGCPTGAVYKAFDAMGPKPMRAEAVRALAGNTLNSEELFNDLATPAESIEPRLREIRATASRIAARPVHVTGSGSTLFALCGVDDDAGVLAATLRDALPECAVMVSKFNTAA